MGSHSCETEKSANAGKKVDSHKQSWSCLPRCSLPLLRWSRKDRQKEQEQQKIMQIRDNIHNDRKKVQRVMESWKLNRATWQRRGEAWRNGEDISITEQRAGRFDFDTARRYRITSKGEFSTKTTTILDFRTPEGREEALQWHEAHYLTVSKNVVWYLEHYHRWENDYQEHLFLQEKSRGRTEQTQLRQVVLKGVPKVRWVRTTAKALPD